jgi:hypothetical protein
MKRSDRIYILLLFLATALSGCKDFLDQPVQGQQVLSNYFANEEECLRALTGCYASLSPQDWWENDFFYLVGDICSDDAFKGNSIEGDQRDFGDLARFLITPQNEWIEIKWRYSYEQIYRTNLVIKNVPEAPVSEELKEQIVAEAKFLRAFAYFELVKNWGDAPLILEPLTANAPKQSRASASELWAQIETDLQEAIDFLPEKSAQSASELGRATKGAAQAYLVKAYVYQEKWAEAETLASQIVASGEYNLNDPFSRVWSVDNPNGNGSIFEIQQKYDDLFDAGSALPVVTRSRADGGWGFCTPSSHLDNFMGDDPRRNLTIIKQGDYVDEAHPQYDTQLNENESGRNNRKYYLELADRPTQQEHLRSPLNHILFRYADLLLLHAEAAWHIGNEAAALTSVNAVRNRVGLDPVSSNGQDLLLDIYHERRMELAMEGHRYYDLKRQRGISQPGFPRLKEVMEDFVDYNLNRSTDPYDKGNAKGALFDVNVHTLFPVPQVEIDLSEGALTQNPGY